MSDYTIRVSYDPNPDPGEKPYFGYVPEFGPELFYEGNSLLDVVLPFAQRIQNEMLLEDRVETRS